jgi:hypothetical protein
MNTEICSHIFDPIEGSGYRHSTQCCVSPADRVHSRVTDVPEAKTPGVDLHVQRVPAKRHEVAA